MIPDCCVSFIVCLAVKIFLQALPGFADLEVRAENMKPELPSTQ